MTGQPRRRAPRGPLGRPFTAVVGAALAGAALAGCAGSGTPDASPASAPSRTSTVSGGTGTGTAPRSVEYLPGRLADVFPAATDRTAPVVVLVPGGSWESARHEALRPLAEHLSASGATVVTASYGTNRTGTHYPEPVAEVACAAGLAVQHAQDQAQGGTAAGPVVVVGHSAGAVLVALAALDPPAAHPGCAYPLVEADAFVGLAGPYDVTAVAPIATAFFGVPPDQAPAAWDAGNPVSQAHRRPQVPALLVHGQLDTVVPAAVAGDFATRLEAAGHDVRSQVLPDADHLDVIHPDVVGDPLVEWLAGLD